MRQKYCMRLPSVMLFVAVALGAIASVAFALPHQASVSAQQTDKYKIFCIDGEVEISTLTREQLEEEREAKVCQLLTDEFEELAEALKAADRFGGVGVSCKCVKQPAD